MVIVYLLWLLLINNANNDVHELITGLNIYRLFIFIVLV